MVRAWACFATARAQFNENRVFLIACRFGQAMHLFLIARARWCEWVCTARNNFFAAGTSAELSPCAIALLNGDRQLRIAC